MYFNYLEKADPEITASIKREINRQETKIEMIASENFVNYEIMEAAGSALTNKYAEGYPGRRYYGMTRSYMTFLKCSQGIRVKGVRRLTDPCRALYLRNRALPGIPQCLRSPLSEPAHLHGLHRRSSSLSR